MLRSRFLWVVMLLLAAGSTGSARYWHWIEFSQPRLPGEYLQDIPTDRYPTPCLPFAKPLAGGPLKVLFLVSKAGPATREVVEIWQRMEMEFEAVTVADSRRLSDSFPLTTAVVEESPEEKERELDRKLEGDYDVIVLAPFQFDKLPAKAQLKILRKLKQGTGLLGFMAGARGTQKAFVPLDPPVAGREILRGCAMAGLPYFGIGPEKPRDEVADQQVFTAHFGAGRIAWLNYAAPHSIDSWYAGDTMGRPARPAPLGMVAPTWQTYDVAIATAVRALLWAAQREQPVRVESDLSDGAEVDRSQWPAQFSAKLTRWSPKAPQEVRVEARLVRPDGEFESTTETTVALTGAETPFQVKLGAPPRGVAFLWLIARDGDGAVLDWSVTSLEVTAPHGIEQLQLQTEVLSPGEEADMRVTLQGQPPEGSLLRLEAVDCYERLFWHRQVPAAAQVTFRVPTVAMCGRAGRLQATLVSGEQVLDRREVELFLRRPVGREFINLLWGYPPLGKASWQEVGYLNRLHAERSRSSGFNMGMIFTYPADDPADHAKGFSRTDASSFYYITHIQTTQVRQYLISEEAREKEAARLEELAGKMRPYGCHAYSLGDENGLYGMSLELKPEEVPHFQEFMRRFYEDDLAALNANWDTNYKGFAEVEGPLAEAGKMTVARRYDAMAFWDWAYADVYRWMAQAVRRGDPEASIGAEGSEGRDLEQVLAELDWWAPYHNRDVNTMLRYWLPWSALRGNWWGSYVANRLGPENLWGQLATGSVNSSMFFISSLGAEGLLATDLENADYAQPWIPEMKEICATAGPVVRGAEPVDDGVGIFHSRLAEVANTLDTRFGSMKTEQTRLLDVFDALGVSAKFLTEREILAGQLDPRQTRILFMAQPKAVTDPLAAALGRYLQAGGVIVGDVALDVRGQHCQEVAPGRLLGLFGARAEECKPLAAEVAFEQVTVPGGPLALRAGECLVDEAVSVGTGKSLAEAGTTPIMIYQQHGKGLALLLNFDFHHLLGQAESAAPATTPAGDFLLALLKLAEVQPQFPPVAGLPWTTVREMRLADATVVGLSGFRGTPEQKLFRVTPGQEVHALRAGLKTAAQGQVTFPAEAPDTMLFCVLPADKREWRLEGPAEVKRGDLYDYQALLVVGGKPLADSLLRVEVLDPTGKSLEAHRDFVMSRTRSLGLRWPVAFNAEPGRYAVRVTELISGTAGELKVTVK